MKAAEVIQEYKNGRRDFRGESLQGRNFKNQDLSGADFSGCDIRGANFSGANLTEVKFEKAKAGLRKRSVVILLLVALVFVVISSFFSAFIGVLVASIFDQSSTKNQIAGWVSLISLLFFSILTWRKNILAGAVAAVGGIVGGIAGAVAAVTGAGAGGIVAAGVGAISIAIAGSGAGLVGTVAVAVTGVGVGVGVGVGGIAVAVAGVAAGLSVMVIAVETGATVAGVGAFLVAAFVVAVAVAFALFFTWIGWLTLKKEHRDPWLRRIVIAFASVGGTSFFQANLNATDFTGATLKSTNFNQAKLKKTIFKQAIKLELARPGKTLLINPQVRELLINPSTGAGQDLTKADLRGANLDGANLQRTNLRLADLSQASFRYANLREANLTEINAVNADLSHATLTEACVENWNIDATTQLENIDCQYVYLLNNQKERRPSSGEFQPGEFTKLFEEVFDTVDLIFRDGMDWKALMNTLKEVQVQNEDTPLQVQTIENKGDGVFIVKVHVPPDANKEKIHQELTEIYQIKAQLTAQDEQLKFLREQNTDLTEIIKIQAQNQTKVEISYNKQDHSQTINVGQDFNINATQESTVNLRDINSSTQSLGEKHDHQ
jgi:uncharacterized protein YjbI with pentapeptide repeats